jgi:Ca2+-transporting ATPase
MITGDYPVTAQRIAREIGLPDEPVVTGEALEASEGAAVEGLVGSTSVFARVMPRQKLRLVETFKKRGEIVAMTGDGVNDAPALQAAHIGIAMGARGTDVAREAAALVLLDDDFSSIVQAIRLGRRIFDNLQKAMGYLIAVHVPIAGMALLPVLFGWPLLLLPIQIVFLELIIDPVSSIAFEAEPEEEDVMRRPPRDPAAPLFRRSTLILSALQGTGILVLVLAAYGLVLARGSQVGSARAAAFAALITGNLGLVLANRSRSKGILGSLGRRNPAVAWIVGVAALVLVAALTVPPIREIFHFSPIRGTEIVLAVGAGLLGLVWLELLKGLGKAPGTVG